MTARRSQSSTSRESQLQLAEMAEMAAMGLQVFPQQTPRWKPRWKWKAPAALGLQAFPQQTPHLNGATQEEEPDWEEGGGSREESEPIPIDPLCDDLTTPADFGLGEGFRTYAGWAQDEFEQQLVPLLRVQFGENGLVETLAKQNQCPAQMLDDVILLRGQHENLARRRSYAMSLHDGDEEPVKANAAAIVKQHRKEFANSEAQKVQREHQKTELWPNLGVGI